LTLPNNVVTEYGYDLASHLTSLTYKRNGNVIGDLTYEYNAAGRRTKMSGSFARNVSSQAYREMMKGRFTVWKQVVGTEVTA